MAVTIASEMEHTQFDLVVAYEMVTAVYAELFGDVPALLEDLELGGFRSALGANQPLLRRWRGRAFWWKLSRAVGRLLKPFDACTVVSESERRLLADVAPGFGPVEVIPNCLDYASYHRIREEPQRNRLVFVGSLDFEANYEAARYFLQRVFPLIQAQVPDTQLWITGRHSRTGLPPEFGAPGVTITGYVDDVRPVMAGSWVSIVPLLRGGGTRLKILEAMALGTPVVSTTKGAEGLDAEAGRHLLIADSAEGFAAAVVRLMLEPGLRSRLVCEARALVSGSHDWPRVAPRFLQLAGQIASRGGSFS